MKTAEKTHLVEYSKFMLIVSSLERAREAYAAHKPTHVISILSEDEPRPEFDGLPERNHLKLYVECETGGQAHNVTAKNRADKIITCFDDWENTGDVLIHCTKGVSRSMAAAYIILCMLYPESDETELAMNLHKAAPHADPCLFLVSHADDKLGRAGRMFDAIDDLPPCRATIDAPIVLLSAAA